jgi:hypothetical protein
MTEAVHPTYVHEITTLKGVVVKTNIFTAGDEPVDVYQRRLAFGTMQHIRIEPNGSLSSVVSLGDEVLKDKTRNSIGSSRRFFLDGLKPRFEIVRPA